VPPTALIQTLEGLRRRVRVLSILYGVGVVVAIGAGLLLGTVVLDYLLNLLPVPRIIVMVAAGAFLVKFLGRWVVRPAMSRLRLSDIAGKLEQAFPDFKDRLRSSVDFLTKGNPGSEMMKKRVVSEAAELAGRFDLKSAVQARPVWESFAMGGGAILILVALGALVGPDYFSPAISRLIWPFENHPWPKRVEIAMVGDLPARVPEGRPVDVRIRLAKGDRASREARVYYQYGDGRVETEIMSRGADGVYSASLDAPGGNGKMTVWIEAGDDATQHKSIAIVQRLSVSSVQLIVTPPPYVHEPASPMAFDSTPATVTYGSTLRMKLTFNKQLDGARPPEIALGEQGGTLPPIAWETAMGNTVSGQWIARDSTSFSVRAFDEDGFGNEDGTEYQVIVQPDQMPSVQITRPARNEECTPQAVVPLRAVAEDDYAIKALRLVVDKVGGTKPVRLSNTDLIVDGNPTGPVVGWARLESAGDRRRWQLDFPWDLTQIKANPALKPGDVIEYHLEAQDNFDFEGKTHEAVLSGKYRITLMSQEQFSTLMQDLVGQVRDELKDIRNSQKSLKAETEDFANQTQGQKQLTKADKEQGQGIVARQATAASQAKQAAGKMDELLGRMQENKSNAQDLMQTAASVRDDLNQVAEHPMKDAAGQIDDARNSDQKPDARNQELAAAQGNQQDAADRLDQMIGKMGDAGSLSQTIDQLKRMLEEQQQVSQKSNDVGLKNLGKTPDQMDPNDQKAQQQNADAQSSLADKTDKTMNQMQQSSQQLSKSDPAASQAMQQAAQMGQQQNVAAQMRQSADAQRQNQQSQAQQAQAQAELGLQTMIHQLEEAQRQQLEELARKLADMKQQIANLMRQQGGLNYDNMALRGDAILKKADQKVLDHLLELVERTKDHLPPTPDLDTQTRLQQQTERNSRGVSKTAESLPDSAELVADLNRAADRMGRAIMALRDDNGTDAQNLAAAYDPPQVEALSALEQAKTIIDQQSEQANQKMQDQRKEAIKAAYQKMLVAQKKIDADTVAIAKAPRGDDGQLGHREEILLDQLPPQQGALAETAVKLGETLEKLDSIVYVWANQDIVDSMNEVKGDLAKPQTDEVTQAQQARIEDQIQAMIDSLSVKPKQIPFANKSNGGGGSGGKGGQKAPTLPTEAELRLEKALQQAVNKATVTISNLDGDHSTDLDALGQRQEQLRGLLDKLVQKSSNGQVKLGPEPDLKDKLPEEASSDQVDDQELTQNLLQGDGSPNPDKMKDDLNLVGQRMGRSRERLGMDHDPGKVTQDIQSRILKGMDDLIDMSREQEAESKTQQPSGQGNQAQPADAQANANPQNSNQSGQQRASGTTPAAQSTPGHDVDTTGTPTTDITQSLKEWGNISPRRRAAVIEAQSEKAVQKFKEYIDGYYQALGNRQAQ
jgi:hypothetical protein